MWELKSGDVLGRGSSGLIFECESQGRPACVKVIMALPGCSSSLDEVEAREVDILKLVYHPRIVHYYGKVQTELNVGIIMERLDSNLPTYLKTMRGSQRWDMVRARERVLSLGSQIAEGLQALHEHAKRIIHRDLHASNILIRYGKGEEADQRLLGAEAVLGDMGLGKMLDGCGSHHGHTQGVGAKHILPPEAATSDYSISYDIWSFGVVMKGMVMWATGAAEDEWHQGKGYDKEECDVVFPKTDEGAVVHGLLESCMEDDPDKRPTARKVKEVLEGLLDKA